MLRRRSFLPALVLAATLGPAVAVGVVPAPTPAAHASATAQSTDPLRVRLRSISPSYLPAKGVIVMRGTVSNVSQDTYTDINLHAFFGRSPITTTSGLEDAAETPETADVGDRITVPGSFPKVKRLDPGEAKPFTVRLQRSLLGSPSPGVYWFGVHALAADENGNRSGLALARDRTFLPVLPTGARTGKQPGRRVPTAVVVPLRAPVDHAADGSVDDVDTWAQDLTDGPLRSLLDLGRTAHGRPVTWLLDPAVRDAVQELVRGNPARSIANTLPPPDQESPSASPSASADGAAAAPALAAADVARNAATAPGRRWLHDLRRVLRHGRDQVLALPYGDLDVDAAARLDRPLIDLADGRSDSALGSWKVSANRAVAPPSGYLDPATLDALPASTTVLTSDRQLSTSSAVPPAVVQVDGRRVVPTSSGAASGGPGPAPRQSALALRQRVLAEAAVRLLARDPQPLVVQVPDDWDRHAGPAFFGGLDVPWVRLTTVAGATASAPAASVPAARMAYPAAERARQVDPSLFSSATQLEKAARTLQSVLTRNNTVAGALTDELLTDVSYSSRTDSYGARARLDGARQWVAGILDQIDLQAPTKVTLSSVRGQFSVAISNRLDVPVTVGVRAASDSDLQITGGSEVQLPPHGRTSVLLSASTHKLGVHTVTLDVVDKSGQPLGSSDQFPMRANQVSNVVWAVLAAGAVLLFGAIVVRLVRRVVRRVRA